MAEFKNGNISLLVKGGECKNKGQSFSALLEKESRLKGLGKSLLLKTRNKLKGMEISLLVDRRANANMAGELTNTAWCYKLELKDGSIYGFTTHDRDLVIEGVCYEASTGFVPTAAETTNKADVDTIDVDGFLQSERITDTDIANGRYDGAKITVFICDWEDTNKDVFYVRCGTVGQVSYGKTSYKAEVRGLTDALQMGQTASYGKYCREQFCNKKCGLDLAAFTFTGKVTAATEDFTAIDIKKESGYFDFGNIAFTSGENAGRTYEIKHYDGTNIILFEPSFFVICTGDTFTITAGCDKNFSTCCNRFKNGSNFRGFPHIPGGDYQMTYPQTS